MKLERRARRRRRGHDWSSPAPRQRRTHSSDSRHRCNPRPDTDDPDHRDDDSAPANAQLAAQTLSDIPPVNSLLQEPEDLGVTLDRVLQLEAHNKIPAIEEPEETMPVPPVAQPPPSTPRQLQLAPEATILAAQPATPAITVSVDVGSPRRQGTPGRGNGLDRHRFRPGVVYRRRRPTTTAAAQDGEPPQAQGGVDERLETFIRVTARPISPPLLQRPLHNSTRRQRSRKTGVSTRRSLRLAARSWPTGDTQARARQVLMRKLGIPEENDFSADDRFLQYFGMFQGPLTDDSIKAMTALCGLEGAGIIDAALL